MYASTNQNLGYRILNWLSIIDDWLFAETSKAGCRYLRKSLLLLCLRSFCVRLGLFCIFIVTRLSWPVWRSSWLVARWLSVWNWVRFAYLFVARDPLFVTRDPWPGDEGTSRRWAMGEVGPQEWDLGFALIFVVCRGVHFRNPLLILYLCLFFVKLGLFWIKKRMSE